VASADFRSWLFRRGYWRQILAIYAEAGLADLEGTYERQKESRKVRQCRASWQCCNGLKERALELRREPTDGSSESMLFDGQQCVGSNHICTVP
jgi:hypothetical protein